MQVSWDDEILDRVWNKLRPYQKEGVLKLRSPKIRLNFDDMGLGKTVTTLFTVLSKNPDALYGPSKKILITCPTKALYVWQQEISVWFDVPSLIYTGTAAKRRKLMSKFNEYSFIITTYGMLKELQEIQWDCIICDEIHEAGLLNHKTKTFDFMQHMSRNSKDVYLLTGTPIRQGVIDLYAPLHLMDPSKFPSYWSFVGRYCITIQTPFGKEIQRNPRNIAEFRNMLNQFMVRRLKSEVLHDLPGKQRNVIPIEMTSIQKKAYQDVLEEFMYADEDAIVITPNSMSAVLRARQIMCTPRLLGIDEDGAALEYLQAEGKNLLENGRSFVVFTPFRSAIPIIADVIKEFGLGTKIYTISGGLKPNEFANQWQGFQENKSQNKVLICVIKSGASFHATSAYDCFFLGYEWDFNMNVQAEDRLCRLGQNDFVQCNYLLYNDCEVDQNLKRTLNSKNDASNWIIGTDKQYRMMLHKVKKSIV